MVIVLNVKFVVIRIQDDISGFYKNVREQVLIYLKLFIKMLLLQDVKVFFLRIEMIDFDLK